MDKIPAREPTSEPTTELEVAEEAATEQTKAKKAKTKRKISSLKLGENFLNEIRNEEKNINQQIFYKFFNYHHPLF